MEIETRDLCLICCYSFKSTEGSEVKKEVIDNVSIIGSDFLEFCQKLYKADSRDIDSNEIIGESEERNELDALLQLRTSGLLFVCPDCLEIIREISEQGRKSEEVEIHIRELQVKVVTELRKLQILLDEYFQGLNKIENAVRNSDVPHLESFFENVAWENDAKAVVVAFRNKILTAATSVSELQTKLDRKLLTSSVSPISITRTFSRQKKTKKTRKVNNNRKVPKVAKISSSFENLITAEAVKIEEEDHPDDDFPEYISPPGLDVGDVETVFEGNTNQAVEEDYYVGNDIGAEDDLEDSDYSPPPSIDNDHCPSSVDNDYCPSFVDSEDELLENGNTSEGATKAAAPVKPPDTKANQKIQKKKKVKKKESLASNFSECIRNMSDFKADIVRRVLKSRALKNRKNALQQPSTSVPSKPGDYSVDDPSQNYSIEYDFSADKLSILQVEIQVDDESKSLNCSACSYSVKSGTLSRDSEMVSNIFMHILGKHLEVFKCVQCNAVLTTRSRYKDHIRGHQGNYMCDVCGRTVSSKGALELHKWQKHLTAEEKQNVIETTGKNPTERIARYKQKQDLRLYPCTTCGKRFQTTTTLKLHQETHLDKDQREQFICPQCGKSFLRQGWLYHQQNACIPDAPLVYCKHCPAESQKSFKTAYLLRKHEIRCHSEKSLQRPFFCSICGKSFKSAPQLKVHEETHSDARPFNCKHDCGANFKTAKHCRRHEGTCKGTESKWRGPRASRSNKDADIKLDLSVPGPSRFKTC